MRPDTPADHTTEAERLLRTAAQYPEDHEPLLLQAAAHLELAGDREQASTLYDRLLAADPEHPLLIKALQAANLWEYGHEAEARALITGIRTAAPADPAPWEIVAETLESHDELEASHDCFTAALTLLLPREKTRSPTQPSPSSRAATASAASWACRTTSGTPWPTRSTRPTRRTSRWTNSTTRSACGRWARKTRPNSRRKSPA